MRNSLAIHYTDGQAHVYGEIIIDQTPNSIVYAYIRERNGDRKYVRTKLIISEMGVRKYSHYSDVLENVEEGTSYWKKRFSELH